MQDLPSDPAAACPATWALERATTISGLIQIVAHDCVVRHVETLSRHRSMLNLTINTLVRAARGAGHAVWAG
jgi:hypothetical protein